MQEPLPLILWRPDITSPLCGWSWYGAHQLLELAGVPFSEWEAVSIPDEILEKAKVLLMPNTARPKPVVEIVRRALAFRESGRGWLRNCLDALAGRCGHWGETEIALAPSAH